MIRGLLAHLLGVPALVALAWAPALAGPLPGDQEVMINGGFAPLHGALLIPDGWQAGPAVLMIPGSGAVDRDGSAPAQGLVSNELRRLAEGLEGAGFPSLRIDKRCFGQSALACPGEDRLTVQTYVEDAVAWARFLKARPGVTCIALLGHSEGALIATIAAARIPTCGLISIAGVGRPFDQVIEGQIKASGADPTLLAKVAEIDGELRAGRRVAQVPPMLMGLYRPSVQPYDISEFAVSPTAAIAQVAAPVLILQGTTDLQVSVADAQALADAHPGARLVILDGVNHVLTRAPPDRAANFAAYANPNLPLAPGVMAPIVTFLRDAAAQAAPAP
jgi:pimeloyl-ACP methyl ester carboxylesterase